jgi:mannose-6-phosphate isomerase-like protein (cupin superfamily)
VRDVEDAFLVLEGSLTVGWEEAGQMVEMELGPRDLVLNPAGRPHWFRNNSAGPCTVWAVIGTEQPETVVFERA